MQSVSRAKQEASFKGLVYKVDCVYSSCVICVFGND